jgi:hypothetical protein
MPRQLSIFSNHLQKWLCGSSYLPLIMARLYTPNRIEPSVEAISIFIHLFTFRSGDIHSNLFSYGKYSGTVASISARRLEFKNSKTMTLYYQYIFLETYFNF